MAGKPHRVVLQERVPGSDPPHFKLHLKPGTLDKPGNKDAHAISCAGEGPGLQVAPASVPEVSNPGVLGRDQASRLYLYIPKVLMHSQLPADTPYPLDISLRVLPAPDGQQGQWAARICEQGRGWRVWLNAGPPLSAYLGRSISKMSLSEDRQLRLTFEPAAPAPAADASMPGPPPQQPQARRPLKRPAAGSTRQQQAVAAGQGSGSSRDMSAAAAAAAGETPGLTAAALTSKKPRRTNQQQQEAAAAAAVGAAAGAATGTGLPFEGYDSQAARAQRAAWRAAKAAAARDKLIKQQQQQQPPAAAMAPVSEPAAAPVPIKQGPDSSTPPAAAAATTGLMFWHMGELSSGSSGSKRSGSDGDNEDGSLGDPDAAVDAAAVDAAAAAIAAAEAAVPVPISQEAGFDAADPAAGIDSPAPIQQEEPDDNMAATTAAAAAGAAAAPHLLPPGVQLQDVSDPHQMEVQLVRLMRQSLMPLLPSEQYAGLMRGVRQSFGPVRRATATAPQLEWLDCMYGYVQAAVTGRQLDDVVEALGDLTGDY